MKCQNCNENRATVHVTTIGDDGAVEQHLCEECAQELNAPVPKSLNPAELLSSLISQVAPEIQEMSGMRCDQCGMTYLEFRSQGRLGCGHDYEAFKTALVPIVEKIHGGAQHTGKAPKHAGAPAVGQTEVVQLRHELEQAVAVEDYERAAKLRDRLCELTGG